MIRENIKCKIRNLITLNLEKDKEAIGDNRL
jgi:hypothetical protein